MPNHVVNRLTAPAAIINQYWDGERFDFNKIVPQPSELLTCSVSGGVTNLAQLAMGQTDLFPRQLDRDAALRSGDYALLSESLRAGTMQRCLQERDLANKFSDEDFEKFISCLRSIRATGHSSWYEWNNEHWSTKWNSYSCERKSETVIEFQTAWNTPEKIFAAIQENHECDFSVSYADEDIGNNVGILSYAGGKLKWSNLGGTKAGYELAFDLHGGKPSYYRLTADGSNYEYFDEDEEGRE